MENQLNLPNVTQTVHFLERIKVHLYLNQIFVCFAS